MKKEKRDKRNLDFALLIEIILVIIVIAFICVVGCTFLKDLNEYQQGKSIYHSLRANATAISLNRNPCQESENTVSENLLSIDFDYLHSINPDCIGYIDLPGTELSYPIVKGKDNNEYLNKTFDGQDNMAGSIFMETTCNSDFSSPHTLLYGHNMKNGTMFRPIRYYKDRSFYSEHPFVYIYLPDGSCMKCNIISTFSTEPDSFVYQTNFTDKEQYVSFVDRIRQESLYPAAAYNNTKRILTLSTCSGSNGQHRFVLILQQQERLSVGKESVEKGDFVHEPHTNS